MEKLNQLFITRYFNRFSSLLSGGYSNVFIILIHDDFFRMNQFLINLKDLNFSRIFFYDVLVQKLYVVEDIAEEGIKVGEKEVNQMFNVYDELYKLLITRENTCVIIGYVYRDDRMLNDFLIAVSQNATLKRNKSKVIVFASDTDIFPKTVLNLCGIVETELPDEKEIEALFEYVKGKIGRDIQKTYIKHAKGLNLQEIYSLLLSQSEEKFKELKIKKLKEYGTEVIYSDIGFNEVGGYEYVKKYFKQKIYLPLMKGILQPVRGVLLYGPPGVGKTYIARALAKEINVPFVSIRMSQIFHSLVGESEKAIERVIKIVESLSPVIVFIDEVDQIAFSRKESFITDSGVTRRIQNTILEWLGNKNRNSIIICATNLIEAIDRAFIRAGRIDDIIPMFYPDKEARKEIFKIQFKLQKINNNLKEKDFEYLAGITKYYTGAEIERIVKESSYIALEKDKSIVEIDDVLDAINTIRINIEKREEYLKKSVEKLRSMELINQKILNEALKEFNIF